MAIAARRDRDAEAGLPFQAVWLVDAPWAHPGWDSYLLSLCDLATELHTVTPAGIIVYKPGVSHELMVYAVDPKVEIRTGENVADWDVTGALLQPANFGYQFAEGSDDDAWERVNRIALMIENAGLSPDTGAKEDWNLLFPDAFSLRVSDHANGG
jgi:hypothetical protein